MRWSIRYQLLVPLLTLLLGVVGAAVWTGLDSAERVRAQIAAKMQNIAAAVNTATWPRNAHTFTLMKKLSGAEFLLCDSSGQPVPDDRGLPLTTLPDVPGSLPEPSDDWQELHLGAPVAVGGDDYFCQGVRLRKGNWVLYTFYPESLWRDAWWAAIRPSLVLGVVGGFGSILLAVLVAQRLSRRVQELERRTRLLAGGDFSPMPLPARNDELRDLGRSVNEMAGQLSQLQETVKRSERLRLLGQVSGGLAHQLRNGVTGARLAVQLHARESNGQAETETLEVALRQLALVELHLKRFLDLGRASELRREPCHIADLLDETAALLRPKCRHTHIDLRFAPVHASDMVLGDRDQLQHLLLNVLTNAIEAAGPGGWVELAMTRCDVPPPTAVIEVCDSGPGPAAEVRDRLFEPFVTGKPEGVGLGLAVARQVIEAHGGSISWSRRSDRTCFRIELPLAESRENVP